MPGSGYTTRGLRFGPPERRRPIRRSIYASLNGCELGLLVNEHHEEIGIEVPLLTADRHDRLDEVHGAPMGPVGGQCIEGVTVAVIRPSTGISW
jgi:hypothetical protein